MEVQHVRGERGTFPFKGTEQYLYTLYYCLPLAVVERVM